MRLVIQTQADRDWIAALPAPEPDDGFDYSDVVVHKPWGFEYQIFQSDILALWVLHLDANSATSLHCHPNKTTALMVVEGTIILSTLHDSEELRPGELVVLEKGTFHRSAATVNKAIIVEAETPKNKRDLIRLDDRYGRQGQGYERH